MTNFEWIISADDKKIAEELTQLILNALRSPSVYHGVVSEEAITKANVEWLNRERVEDD